MINDATAAAISIGARMPAAWAGVPPKVDSGFVRFVLLELHGSSVRTQGACAKQGPFFRRRRPDV